MKNLHVKKKQFRAIDSTKITVDVENRTMEFSFSSETPYERYYGFEIISHAKGAMNLDRLKNGAPLLFNHDMDKQLGVIEDAWVGDDKRGYVKVRFGKSQFADEKFQDAQDAILKNVSFGYIIDDIVLTKKGSDSAPSEYTVTKCFPYEVSLVTVPADYSVGVGRDGEPDEDIEIEIEEPVSEEPAVIEQVTEPETKTAVVTAPKGVKMDENQIRAEAVKAEGARRDAIQALADKHGNADLARQLIEKGATIEEARGAYLEKIGTAQKPITGNEAVVGLTEKEISKFSFMKAIHAMANPNDKHAQEAAKFEREVSEDAQKKSSKSARGFMIPVDILRAGKRDLVVGTSTAGGNLVATDLLAGSFIDLLRNKSVLMRAGAMTLNGLTSNISVPRQTGGATAYWVSESGAPTESQQAFDQVAMSPKTLGAFTDYSRKLTLQSSIDVENMVRMDLASVIALEIDRAGLYGSGSGNQPTGVKNVSGINTSDFAANAPTFAEMVGLETLVAADNADIGTLKYLVNATGRGSLKTTEKASSTAQYIWEAGNTVNGYSVEVSNQIAANDFWFGNWGDLMIGLWSGLDILVDPYTGGTAGTIRVIAHQDCDVAVRHPESFARGNNTL